MTPWPWQTSELVEVLQGDNTEHDHDNSHYSYRRWLRANQTWRSRHIGLTIYHGLPIARTAPGGGRHLRGEALPVLTSRLLLLPLGLPIMLLSERNTDTRFMYIKSELSDEFSYSQVRLVKWHKKQEANGSNPWPEKQFLEINKLK